MVLGIVGALLDGGFMVMNVSSLGWISRENVSHEEIMIKNQGLGFS